MRNAALVLVASTVLPVLILAACKKKQEEQPPQYPGYAGQAGYAGQPGYGGQPGYAGQAGQPGYGGTGAAPAGTATGGQPAPMAFPCQSDATCGLHKCNVGVGRCQWPCSTNDDCQPGNTCMTPFCVPGAGAPK